MLYKNEKNYWDQTRYFSHYGLPTLVIQKKNIKWVDGVLISSTTKPNQKPEGHYVLTDVLATNYYLNGNFITDLIPIGTIYVYSVADKNNINPEYSSIAQKAKPILGADQHNEYTNQSK